jgi:hypothetical protein
VENLASTGIRSPDRPARSESPFRVQYPGLVFLITARKFVLEIKFYIYLMKDFYRLSVFQIGKYLKFKCSRMLCLGGPQFEYFGQEVRRTGVS